MRRARRALRRRCRLRRLCRLVACGRETPISGERAFPDAEAEGPEVGFTRPVDGAPNVEYLKTADAAEAERILLETLNRTR